MSSSDSSFSSSLASSAAGAAAEESAAAATGAAEAKASGLAKYSLAWGGERKRDEQVSLCYERAMIAMLYPSPHLFLLLL